MNRDTLLRSHRFLAHPLVQSCLFASFALVVSPAWGLPLELGSRSAIDLIEVREQAIGVSGIDASVANSNSSAFMPVDTPSDPLLPTAPAMLNSQRSSLLPLAAAQATPSPEGQSLTPSPIDLDPKLIESSPILQRWLKKVPDVLADIKRDPGFRTRLRLGYTQFPSSNHASGLNVGLEDVFVGRSGLTLNADYQTAFNGQRASWGSDLRYYVRPLGSVINVAPVLGYRHLETTRYSTEGIHVGLRLLLVPSRTGAADLALTQSWVAPRGENEVGLTTLSFGYALTHNLRLSTDIQKQNSRVRSDSRVGINLEWMF